MLPVVQWCVLIVIVMGFNGVCHGLVDYGSFVLRRLRVGKCRAACLDKFASSNVFHRSMNTIDYGCTSKFNWKCNMCWDYCDMLTIEHTREQMCEDEICMEGCRFACTQFESRGGFSRNGISGWFNVPRRNLESHFTVNIAFGLEADGNWNEIGQNAGNWLEMMGAAEEYRKIFTITTSSRGILSFTTTHTKT